MADIKDVTAVIASALAEVSLAGSLDVKMDGGESVEVLGPPSAGDVEVTVVVSRVGEGSPPDPRPDRG
ncbi:hypothetical protein K7957_10265 [Sphingomonas yunnanensis]|uniref:hypothetical protein n=1 Tax=Sphingomonas yunnanensis TaxID=310400 RepID=UPI001CA754BA|nr:hypothetical protein [Sphingomonas yunnanensis]MBY9063314.1 hypothetical protein [Sphingomonas yunnanensis]